MDILTSTPGLAEDVLELIEKDAPEDVRENLQALAKAYLRRLPPEFGSIDSEDAYRQVRSLLDFIAVRTEPFAVRVFNPTRDEHGYDPGCTVVEVVSIDSPFLIDSVTNELHAAGVDVARVLHPVVGIDRDAEGRLVAVRHARHTTARESVQHHELSRRLFDADLPAIEQSLREVLFDVRRVVQGFHAMVGRVDRMVDLARISEGQIDREAVEEACSLLHWLKDDNFVFLGYREYRLFDTESGRAVQIVPDTGLGLLNDDSESNLAEPKLLADLPKALADRYRSGDLVVVSKSNRASTVHRRARMDYVGVRLLGPDGETNGEARLLGLFTSKSYMEPASKIPVLRKKLNDILAAEDLIPGSHDAKAVTQLFDGFSKHDLFAASTEDLGKTLVGLMAQQQRRQVRIFVRRDLLQRNVSVLVAMPRDRFNADLRKRLQAMMLERFGGASVEYHLALGEGENAQIHFTVWVPSGEIEEVDYEKLELDVIDATRSWQDRLEELLVQQLGESEGGRLAAEWVPSFPEYYTTSTSLELAAGDVAMLDVLSRSPRSFVVGLQNDVSTEGVEPLTRIALYRAGGKLPLTSLVPAMEDMGLVVVEEVPTRLGRTGTHYIHDFGVLGPDGQPLDLAVCSDRVAAALSAVWANETASDSLNRLVVTAGLTHKQVEILRAYRTYWRRVSPVFTISYVNDTLNSHPELSAVLVAMFEERFDPDVDESGYSTHRDGVLAALEAIPSLDEDRILRAFVGLIEATARTNAYQEDRSALSLKFISRLVPDMPRPYPMAEIFVLAPGVEGIHLRGGPVARGGIRWSDRREDYRTEVLGLMKAQMTKNAVIVPNGAKGGFVLTRRPVDPAALRERVQQMYEVFIRGLLDITDNLVANEVVHPERVKIHDGEDPYLVVAADKGTATFSDVANRIAAEYGFWLGDAFASGGSAGYDHKALGITARGAWKSLERHFSEMGKDPHVDTFSAIGIGDMSGDVFGNGMLGSDRIMLLAAFDHRHVFIDPDPDPRASFEERKRLFDLPRSSWADYDESLISDGGGVFDRSAKKVSLSARAREVLGIEDVDMTPAALINRILKAPVDLLWNGGIGTYVKASTELNEQVGDRANDPVRVSASELRCKVVVEGGNLGLTQQGRIEFARNGGRVNTDFIDNSGGVDCSDREVNLKILLGVGISKGILGADERDELIASVASEIVERILYDNFLQAQMISLEQDLSTDRMEDYEALMGALEAAGILVRELEGLPPTDEMRERARAGIGLERPEIAVLLVDAKRYIYDRLIESDLVDNRYFLGDLAGYFPEAVVERCTGCVEEHPLRREIIATLLANDIVNSGGSTFVQRLASDTSASVPEIVAAYRVARDLTGATDRWDATERLFGEVDVATFTLVRRELHRLVDKTTRWHLAHPDATVLDESVKERARAFASIEDGLAAAGSAEWARERERTAGRLSAAGVPDPIARSIAYVSDLLHAPDIIDVAASTSRSVEEVSTVFAGIGQALGLDKLERIAMSLRGRSNWQRWAKRTLLDDLTAIRRELSQAAFKLAGDREATQVCDHFLVTRAAGVARLVRFLRRVESEPVDDVAPLMVAVRQVRSLVG